MRRLVRRLTTRCAQAVGAVLAATVVWAAAQAGGMPVEIAARVAAIGPVIDPPQTATIYAPLQQTEPYRRVKVTRDIKFGADERQALDLFVPDGPTAALRPVLMFVHGGGFLRGQRRAPDSPFYDNIMLFAVHNGIVGVNTTYRLAPQHPWPAGAEDVASAVRWVGENIAAYGGDPKRVFLMGHSAGAVHVATYVAHPGLRGEKDTGLAGAILVSGLYDFTAREPGDGEKAYFGVDTSKYAERSSLSGLVAAQLPLMTVHAELDPPPFQEDAKQLNEELCRAGRCPRAVRLAKHSHMSETYAINTDDTSLSDEILAFVRGEK
ncbi:MAG: alpha/beta hydrolase [Hyphomicrobiaceae bacterium]|nr:alpha/beta hydrolase [Hyphomicrobiaceae bacterium]